MLFDDLRGPLRPHAGRARELVGRVAAERDEVRHLLGLDAVALPHLVGADPGQLADAARRCEDRHRLAASWNESRSDVTTSAGQRFFLAAATAAARKSSASYPGAFAAVKPSA